MFIIFGIGLALAFHVILFGVLFAILGPVFSLLRKLLRIESAPARRALRITRFTVAGIPFVLFVSPIVWHNIAPPRSHASIPGKYEFRNGPSAHLELRKNFTYQLCVESKPCETGIYDFEVLRPRPDRTYQQCLAHEPNACGRPFHEENPVHAVQIFFDPGVEGPMKKFNYPPDGKIINGAGQDITTRGSEASTIDYDWYGQPMFTFTDPDSGLYFYRISD